MSKQKKKGKQDDRILKGIILLTAILNLIRAAIDLIAQLIE